MGPIRGGQAKRSIRQKGVSMKEVRETLVKTEDIYLAKYWLEIWRAERALLISKIV